MTVDAWLTGIVTLELTGTTMEGLNALMNYCKQYSLAYDCDAKYSNNQMEFTMSVVCNNEQAYLLIRDYKNRGGNN